MPLGPFVDEMSESREMVHMAKYHDQDNKNEDVQRKEQQVFYSSSGVSHSTADTHSCLCGGRLGSLCLNVALTYLASWCLVCHSGVPILNAGFFPPLFSQMKF